MTVTAAPPSSARSIASTRQLPASSRSASASGVATASTDIPGNAARSAPARSSSAVTHTTSAPEKPTNSGSDAALPRDAVLGRLIVILRFPRRPSADRTVSWSAGLSPATLLHPTPILGHNSRCRVATVHTLLGRERDHDQKSECRQRLVAGRRDRPASVLSHGRRI